MKKSATLILLTGVSLFYQGCINYEQRATINQNGAGEMNIHYWTKESVVGWISDGKLVFNEAELKDQYGANARVKTATVESVPDDSTRHVRVSLEFDDLNKLSNVRGFQGTSYEWKNEGSQIVFTQTMEANSSANGLGLEEYTVTYTYEMPGTVVSSNATRVDGNTLTWEFRLPELSKNVMLTATMNIDGGISSILLLIIGVVVLAAISLLVIQKRKANRQT